MEAELGGEGEGDCMNGGVHAAFSGMGARMGIMEGCALRSSDA